MDTAFTNPGPMRPAGATALGAGRRTRIVTPRTRNAGPRTSTPADVRLRTRLRRGGHEALRAIRAFGGAAFSVVVLGSGTEAAPPRH
ncbi:MULTISPECIES: hypothetical protein [unclassified Streptomyces]|uniref:hypothetical protein n=1 Tax=unclassified Streptomyces TaxID=2593676 RepID=UPI002DD814B0|nr:MULTISPECIES: hypothetical protein [unclassified Streptomyces]WSA93977.1 hypothetical protein OIE63_22125 [Streptomyces sp. NBC_01795]WSB78403.1 hypothetical protein OHB04_23255 [Streptomyces sp. NBC_01775]WSS13395.1 hypothetical protein OG533_16985 [Streptomyces sp. NBC_01186]WSS42184.1 hypothetical protein OG220_17545 [Streptomyces sp. NBC_01187]